MIIPINIELLVIAAMTSIACVLPGTFLLLRGISLMSDAISHAILPGIVLMFFATGKLNSPLLIVGAACAGLLTVVLTETIIQTERLKKDAAIGLVFALFFSFGIILISHYARSIHLDMDMVILGSLIFAAFKRIIISSVDCGSYALWTMTALALINSALTYLTLKECAITIFDPLLGSMLRFRPNYIYYTLMTITSITCLCAFDIVGAIVVVALMIVPAASAYLLAHNLQTLLLLALYFGLSASWGGYMLAHLCDVSIAGSIATMCGIIFLIALLCALMVRKKACTLAQDTNIQQMLVYHYIATAQATTPATLQKQFSYWSSKTLATIVKRATEHGDVIHTQTTIKLSQQGQQKFKQFQATTL